MSAAATAAGYLYASGRLRGRGAREQEHHDERSEHKKGAAPVASPLLYQGRIYVVQDGGRVSCYEEKTGKILFEQERLNACGGRPERARLDGFERRERHADGPSR